MRFEQAFRLSQEEARKRIEALCDYWHNHYGIAVAWTGDSARLNGTAKGITFDATLQVGPGIIQAEGSDPGFLMRPVVTAYFKRKLAEYLDPSKPLESLERA